MLDETHFGFYFIPHTQLSQWVGKIGLYDRPGTVKSPAVPSNLKPSLHRIRSGWYLPHMTEAGARVGSVRIQMDPSSLCPFLL